MGVGEISEFSQVGPIHGRTRETLVDQDGRFSYSVSFVVSELLAGFNLGGDGEALALIFGRQTEINGGMLGSLGKAGCPVHDFTLSHVGDRCQDKR
jgi:hypothetical protein